MPGPEKMSTNIEEYLKHHPEVERAMQIFGLGMEEYSRAFRGPKITTTNTTNYPEGSSAD